MRVLRSTAPPDCLGGARRAHQLVISAAVASLLVLGAAPARAMTVGVGGTVGISQQNNGVAPKDSTGADASDTTNHAWKVSCVTGCTSTSSPIPAGSNVIGKVGIDQTTPGTTNGVQVNAALPAGSNVIGGVTQSGVWSDTATGNVASGSADSGNPVKVGGVYNSTPPTFTTGQRGDLQVDSRGFLITSVGQAGGVANVNAVSADGNGNAAGLHVNVRGLVWNGSTWDRQRGIAGAISSAGVGVAAVEQAGAAFSHIATNATTTVKSGAGILHKICINTKGASANTATVFDNTLGSGTAIAVLDTTSGVGCQAYDVAFATGLTIVTATGTAPDLTVAYR